MATNAFAELMRIMQAQQRGNTYDPIRGGSQFDPQAHLPVQMQGFLGGPLSEEEKGNQGPSAGFSPNDPRNPQVLAAYRAQSDANLRNQYGQSLGSPSPAAAQSDLSSTDPRNPNVLASYQAQQDAALRNQMGMSPLATPERVAQEKLQGELESRKILKNLVGKGGEIDTAALGKALLPYDTATGINLIKAAKEEQAQKQLMQRTGGTGVAAPAGYRWTKEGNLEAISGGAADPAVLAQLEGIKSYYKAKEPKALTESQGNAAGFGMRAAESSHIIGGLAEQGVSTPGLLRQTLPEAAGGVVNVLPTWLGGPNEQQQQVDQAQRDFVNAVLRKESGASISTGEFANAKKQYFPQPGDLPAVIAQKEANRNKAIDALRIQAGPGGENIPRPEKKETANWQSTYKSQAQAVQDAMEAIRKGAPRDAVRQRLQEIGITDARL